MQCKGLQDTPIAMQLKPTILQFNLSFSTETKQPDERPCWMVQKQPAAVPSALTMHRQVLRKAQTHPRSTGTTSTC
jgi:hypothetical protein